MPGVHVPVPSIHIYIYIQVCDQIHVHIPVCIIDPDRDMDVIFISIYGSMTPGLPWSLSVWVYISLGWQCRSMKPSVN